VVLNVTMAILRAALPLLAAALAAAQAPLDTLESLSAHIGEQGGENTNEAGEPAAGEQYDPERRM